MFDVNVVSAHRNRRYSIAAAGEVGWEVMLVEDQSVRMRETYADWHRVERALTRMQQEVSRLLDQGWTIQPVSR
jgi:hypothetical protein